MQLNTKKFRYAYAAIAQADLEEDGEIKVMFLRVCKLEGKQAFKADPQDISYINFHDILEVLPSPAVCSRRDEIFYIYTKNVPVFEQG